MAVQNKLALKTFGIYLLNAFICMIFLLGFGSWLWLQCILAVGVCAGFCLLCYNEGGNEGERACTLERTAQKRIEEGKNVDESMKKDFFDKKKAVAVLLMVALPMCALATANLIASPNYPVIEAVQETAEEESEDPFGYGYTETAKIEQYSSEPMGYTLLRVITRMLYAPLIPLYTILETDQTLLYALFIPFSFVMPACTAVGYLNGPKIRDKKIKEIAKGKVRKKRGLLVGKDRQQRGPKQPKPLV